MHIVDNKFNITMHSTDMYYVDSTDSAKHCLYVHVVPYVVTRTFIKC